MMFSDLDARETIVSISQGTFTECPFLVSKLPAKKMSNLDAGELGLLMATITCPACAHYCRRDPRTAACIFYECAGCRSVLRPIMARYGVGVSVGKPPIEHRPCWSAAAASGARANEATRHPPLRSSAAADG